MSTKNFSSVKTTNRSSAPVPFSAGLSKSVFKKDDSKFGDLAKSLATGKSKI